MIKPYQASRDRDSARLVGTSSRLASLVALVAVAGVALLGVQQVPVASAAPAAVGSADMDSTTVGPAILAAAVAPSNTTNVPATADASFKVGYDDRAFTINGKRKLLVVGAIHYPRSTPGMWPELMRRSKEAGVNTIETYVFWNLHEPERGQYDFSTDRANLPLFLKLAHEAGLFVSLRIGPYVCAEWNYGGLPAWLRDDPNSKFRTWDPAYMDAMESFVRKTVAVVEPFLPRNGGPIIAMQIENEYGNVIHWNDWHGREYLKWSINLAKSIDAGVPWFMCQQDGTWELIVGCNGFYCDNWIWGNHKNKNDPNTPAMFTELWSGWFQNFGDPRPLRPAEDLAYSAARFYVRSGTYVSYYMWHGGTNFGRTAGNRITTTYDYDAPITEYGFRHATKYAHLAQMHQVLGKYADVIVDNDINGPPGSGDYETHTYGDTSTPNSIVFLSNNHKFDDHDMEFDGTWVKVPHRSVTFLVRDTADGNKWKAVFNTATIQKTTNSDLSSPATAPVHIPLANFASHTEAPGIWNASLAITRDGYHAEQLSITRDKTDCMWYVKEVDNDLQRESGTIYIGNPWDVIHSFIDGVYIGRSESESHDGNNGFRLYAREALEKAGKPTNGKHTVQIMTCASGLFNYGNNFENEKKGLLGKDYVSGQYFSEGTWSFQAGTLGEYMKVFDPSFADNAASPFWMTASNATLPINTPLTWYRTTIPKATIQAEVDKLRARADKEIDHPMLSFALYTGSLERGEVWVNGHSIGRFDNSVKSTWSNKCNEGCDYRWDTTFNVCRTNCGKPSQEYLHVPADWLLNNGNADPQITLFDQRGSDPRTVYLVPLFG
ncbi:Beta-galactosidase 7 [Polyrhizophydium stewartii]|uniref:Beta-galactosidase n=1 Tax=Polyrhizophydium stewartii TaxID=2732419 RepID=A0ABR4MYZ5_9FUNG